MTLSEAEARRRFTASMVARLATATGDGHPHLVPVTFAVEGDLVVVAVDHKPKRTNDLKRLRNIRANPQVSLLADRYEDDWSRLWWARADGRARVIETSDPQGSVVRALCAKYGQYASRPPAGPVIEVSVTSWSGWAYAE